MRTRRSGHLQRGVDRGLSGRLRGLGQLCRQQIRTGRSDRKPWRPNGRAEHQSHSGLSVTGAHRVPVSEALVVAQRTISDYTEAQASLDLHLNGGLDGKQAGNPDKVAFLILQAASADTHPCIFCRRLLPPFAGEQKMHAVSQDIDVWRSASDATDFGRVPHSPGTCEPHCPDLLSGGYFMHDSLPAEKVPYSEAGPVIQIHEGDRWPNESG